MIRQDSKTKNNERRLSQEQYDMLLGCLGKKDIMEWNQWRKRNPAQQILLENADFLGLYLECVDLKAANPDSWGGQTLLMMEVILGYVLLSALVIRFAVFFTAGWLSGKFVYEEKEG